MYGIVLSICCAYGFGVAMVTIVLILDMTECDLDVM